MPKIIGTQQLSDGSKGYVLDDGRIIDEEGNVVGSTQKPPSQTDQLVQTGVNTVANQAGQQVGQQIAGQIGTQATTQGTGAAVGGMSQAGSSAVVDGTVGGMSVAGSSGGAAANTGGTAGTEAGASSAGSYAAAAGAAINSYGNIKAFDSVKDRTDGEKARDAARVAGLAVADFYTYGLSSTAFHMLQRSKRWRNFEKKMENYNLVESPMSSLGTIWGGGGKGRDWENFLSGGVSKMVGITQKSTEEYRQERWRDLGRKSPQWKNYHKLMEERRDANPDEGTWTDREDPTGKYVGQKWSWDAMQDIARSTGNYRGFIGAIANGDTFGDAWMETPIEQQLEVSRLLQEEGLYVSDKGDILLKKGQKDRAREIFESVRKGETPVRPVPQEAITTPEMQDWEKELAAKQEERRLEQQKKNPTVSEQIGANSPQGPPTTPQPVQQPSQQPQPTQGSSIQTVTPGQGGAIVNGQQVKPRSASNNGTTNMNNQMVLRKDASGRWTYVPASANSGVAIGEYLGGASTMDPGRYNPSAATDAQAVANNGWQAFTPQRGQTTPAEQVRPQPAQGTVFRSQPNDAPAAQEQQREEPVALESLKPGVRVYKDKDGTWRHDKMIQSPGGGWYGDPRSTEGRDPDVDHIFTDGGGTITPPGELKPPIGALAQNPMSQLPASRGRRFMPDTYDLWAQSQANAENNQLMNTEYYRYLTGKGAS